MICSPVNARDPEIIDKVSIPSTAMDIDVPNDITHNLRLLGDISLRDTTIKMKDFTRHDAVMWDTSWFIEKSVSEFSEDREMR